MKELQNAIALMKKRIVDVLDPCIPSIYIYGSVVLDDFKPGWSDIDLLILTKKPILEEQANKLVRLRQIMLEDEPGNPYYRAFEGGMLPLNSFLSGKADRVVYWGTGGEKITDKYDFNAFCMSELIDNGVLIYGNDIRNRLSHPTFDDLKSDVQKHYEAIRRYAPKTGRSLYAYGWLLDISRCIYTLRTGKLISKTAAGEWALQEALCPCADILVKAVEIRNEPNRYKKEERVFDHAELLFHIQRYADVLENELFPNGFSSDYRMERRL